MGCLRCADPLDLPSPVVERTKLVLLDCIGAIAAGMQEPEMRNLVQRLANREAGSSGQVPVIGAGRRMSPLLASLLNGTAGTMLELDEATNMPAATRYPCGSSGLGRR